MFTIEHVSRETPDVAPRRSHLTAARSIIHPGHPFVYRERSYASRRTWWHTANKTTVSGLGICLPYYCKGAVRKVVTEITFSTTGFCSVGSIGIIGRKEGDMRYTSTILHAMTAMTMNNELQTTLRSTPYLCSTPYTAESMPQK